MFAVATAVAAAALAARPLLLASLPIALFRTVTNLAQSLCITQLSVSIPIQIALAAMTASVMFPKSELVAISRHKP
jgi:hypothetical protein